MGSIGTPGMINTMVISVYELFALCMCAPMVVLGVWVATVEKAMENCDAIYMCFDGNQSQNIIV
jgi:hypothetical protein